MNRFFLIIVIVFSVANSVTSQELSSDIWHEGTIVLKTNDTLRGAVKYNIEENILQYRYSNKMITLSPNKIISFYFYDELIKANRYFRSFEYSPYSSYKPEMFFEVLVVGNLSLLAREYISYETRMINDPFLTNDPYYNMYANSASNYVTRRVINYHFYFFNHNSKSQNVILYKEKKKDLFRLMNDKQDEIKQFIKDKKILYNTRRGLSVITEYYNSLK
ncbi:MAG: hypothetical protein RH860_04775 [Cytophagales bacterium]